jgi:hypothetical protein
MSLTSGCFAFINTTPLSKNNEYKNPELAGAWYAESKDGTSVIYIEDKGDHYISYSLSSLSKVRITTSKITAVDKKSEMDFICADISFIKPKDVHQEISLYFIAGFQTVEGKLYLLNFYDAKNNKERLNALPRFGNKGFFQADSATLKKFLSENLNCFKVDRFKFTKCEFKNQEGIRTFIALSEYTSFYMNYIAQISWRPGPSEPEKQKLKRELVKNMKDWLTKNGSQLPPSLKKEAEVLCQHLETSPAFEFKNEIAEFLFSANNTVFNELIKH